MVANNMKVEIRDEEAEEHVVLYKDSGKKHAPCEWVNDCDKIRYSCKDCPADSCHDFMTHAEAIEWWSKQ